MSRTSSCVQAWCYRRQRLLTPLGRPRSDSSQEVSRTLRRCAAKRGLRSPVPGHVSGQHEMGHGCPAGAPGATLDSMRGSASIAVAIVLASCARHDRAVGESCGYDGDCELGSSCAAVDAWDGGASYACVAHCNAGAATHCDGGGVCWPVSTATPDVWGCFPGNDVPIGQPCWLAVGCVRGALCQPRGDGGLPGVCAPVCVPLCGPLEHCYSGGDCEFGLACVTVGTMGTLADNECVPVCAPVMGDVGLCPDGLACAPFERSDGTTSHACYPGGATPLGATCTGHRECERGAVCVGDGATGICSPACNMDSDCPNGARCTGGICGP